MIEAVPDRADSIGRLYADANLRMGEILAHRTPGDLAVINAFLAEVIHAARASADGLDAHSESASLVHRRTPGTPLPDARGRGLEGPARHQVL
jgi:hypothetical protein